MQKTISLKNQTIKYTLRRHSLARRLSISVNQSGRITATLPLFSRISTLESFLQARADWIINALKRIQANPPGLLSQGNRREYLARKEEARQLVIQKLSHFNQFYGFQYRRIAIRNQKSRWGSCSSQKNLNFNWRIVLLLPAQADYLVVHELCHLKELNHSSRFWQLVEQTIPDHRQLRKELTKL